MSHVIVVPHVLVLNAENFRSLFNNTVSRLGYSNIGAIIRDGWHAKAIIGKVDLSEMFVDTTSTISFPSSGISPAPAWQPFGTVVDRTFNVEFSDEAEFPTLDRWRGR